MFKYPLLKTRECLKSWLAMRNVYSWLGSVVWSAGYPGTCAVALQERGIYVRGPYCIKDGPLSPQFRSSFFWPQVQSKNECRRTNELAWKILQEIRVQKNMITATTTTGQHLFLSTNDTIRMLTSNWMKLIEVGQTQSKRIFRDMYRWKEQKRKKKLTVKILLIILWLAYK